MMNTEKQKIKIFADTEAMSRAAAETLIRHISDCLRVRETFAVALSGGSTPRRLYSLLANEAALRDMMPWERIHFFWGDERCVPPDHPESNYRMADHAMLSKVPIPSKNIHRIHAENSDAEKVAADYEAEIRRFFGIQGKQIPVFDFVLLGMGADGHTASLFPATSALAETERLVVANWVAKFQSTRLTLTLPVFNHAIRILFLVCGEDKAETLRAVLEGKRQPDRYPAQRIRPSRGQLWWFLDRSAAGRLEQKP
ncbi:MAG: 6-phosphogluconolactonase [Deltaproteobacteria bacterium]|jgi:6-phosphogluconolactonase